MTARDEDRVSLDGLTPEEALRALLAVKPEAQSGEGEDGEVKPPRTPGSKSG